MGVVVDDDEKHVSEVVLQARSPLVIADGFRDAVYRAVEEVCEYCWFITITEITLAREKH